MRRSRSVALQLFLVALTWLCFGQVPSYALASVSCQKIYADGPAFDLATAEISVHWGHLYQQKVPFPVPADSLVYHLGEGMMGGDVYRVLHSDASTTIFKVYKKVILAYEDARRLQIIDTALAQSSSIVVNRFQAVKARSVSAKIYEVTDTFGSTLSHILESPQVSGATKAKLRQKYKACLRDLFQLLKKLHPKAELDKDGFIELDPSQETTDLSIFIHMDNVIVTPSLDLVVIDPY